MYMCYLYSGIPFDRLVKLSMYDYRIILINAFVKEANKSEEGKKMLKLYKRTTSHDTTFDTAGLLSIM